MTEWFLNSCWRPEAPSILDAAACEMAFNDIRQWQVYKETELLDLKSAALQLSVNNLFYKDESTRFGLGSFKALGAPYALSKELERVLRSDGLRPEQTDLSGKPLPAIMKSITAACATDGNHGRALAWACSRFGCACRVYVPSFVSQFRKNEIEKYGARVTVVSGTYDEAASMVEHDAVQNDWLLISDSGAGRDSVAASVMRGYTVISYEALQRCEIPFTHCFIQAGVGGLAAAIADSLCRPGQQPPTKIIVVEPESAACLFASAIHSRLMPAAGSLNTVAGGLACGTPSPLAWGILHRKAHAFMTVTESQIVDSMRYLARHAITAGESGAVGFAGLMSAANNPKLRGACKLNEEASVLIIGTEGATDPELYQRVLSSNPG